MATMTESAPRNHITERPEDAAMGARTVPILPPTIKMSAPSPGDPMDVTTPTNSSAPGVPGTKSPESEANGDTDRPGPPTLNDQASADSFIMPAPVAAAAVHQPKIVQTAFIHKLYNMLEDQTISHLITWTPPGDSFIMQPSQDFARVLAQYFKHTNISSFVRQLNMYGFHKVSDVFHHGGTDAAMWEFKHGGGNFKRGDTVGLREIKRRPSKHGLVHRTEYSSTRSALSHQPLSHSQSQPVTPAEPMPPMYQESNGDPRSIDNTLYEMSLRLARSEEIAQYTQMRQHAMMDTVARLLHYNQEITRAVLAVAPSDHPILRDGILQSLQGEIQRQTELLRSLDEPQEPSYNRSNYFSNIENGNAPVSPRQLAQDDPRRSSLSVPQPPPRQPHFYRPQVPSNLSISTRRTYGSIPGSSAQSSPSSIRPAQIPPPPPGPHPLANVELGGPGSLARRHTSADIRAHGWQAHNQQPPPPPFPSSGPPSTQWPSSPSRIPPGPEDQRIRESFSTYSLQSASSQGANAHSRPSSPQPPPSFHNYANGNGAPPPPGGDSFGSWNWNKANTQPQRDRLAPGDGSSAPPTRRGSMAHILNPTDTAEREEEDDDPVREEDRKRKRLT